MDNENPSPSRPSRPNAGTAVLGPDIAPPVDPRPGSAGVDRPRPASEPPADAEPGPTPPLRRTGRTALAFLAGAAIAAGSFGLGVALTDDGGDPEPAAAPLVPIAADAESDSGTDTADGHDTDAVTPPQIQSDDPVAAVAQLLGPSVLQVETNLGQGSGVVYADGLILTNQHVIDGASDIIVRSSDGRTFDAELLGGDTRNDIAVLSIGEGSGLPVAALATDADPVVGQLAVAIGSPFDLSQTVTAGIVSALNRPVPNEAGGISAMIQTDAPINPGNSGGALANAAGQVIGINASIRTDGSGNGNVGIGFAVPIDTAIGVAERIVAGEPLDPGVLGVTSSDQPDNDIGVVFGDVVDGGAADEAGLLAGDRLILIDGAPVTDFGEVVGLIQGKFAGEPVELVVQRGDETIETTAVLD